MTRWLQVVSVLAAAGASVFVFQVKYRAESVADHAGKLQRELDQENEVLSLLEAEWSLLVQPARVQELVERHAEQFKLQPLDPLQITRMEDLPWRPKGPAPEDESALSAILEGLPEEPSSAGGQASSGRDPLPVQPQRGRTEEQTGEIGEQ